MTYETTTDQPTLAIFASTPTNLDGHDGALGHDIMIAADGYLPTDEHQVPTGEVLPVDGTPFDFREMSGRSASLGASRCSTTTILPVG